MQNKSTYRCPISYMASLWLALVLIVFYTFLNKGPALAVSSFNELAITPQKLLGILFFNEWWAYVLAIGLALLTGVWFGCIFRKRKTEGQNPNTAKLLAELTDTKNKNQQLLEQNKTLAEINEEKEQLLGLVAHDLKNPLGQIKGLIGILQNYNPPPEEQKEIMSRLIDTAERMEYMVSRTLSLQSFSKPNAHANKESIDLKEVVRDIARDFLPLAEKKSIKLTCDLPDNPAYCNLDKTYFLQVVENLLSNAIKFSPSYLEVKLSLSINAEGDSRVSIKDQGPGFSEEDKKRIFGKFQRLSAKPTDGEQSTGLGLSIVKTLVDAMGGKIWYESQEGKGTEFFVDFPCNSSANG